MDLGSVHVDLPENCDLSLEENSNTDIIPYTSLKIRFPGKSYIEFWVGIGKGVPLPQENYEYVPSFRNTLSSQDWILSNGSHQNKVRFTLR